MTRFIDEADRSQGVLLPETIDEYVAEENPVRVIEAFVAALELSSLGFARVEPKATGRPGYHPATMLKLYLYGYLNRMQSSRRLEQEARRNLELMWLVGRLAPDFKTIADFRAENAAAIRNVCREFIVLCRRWNLFTEATVAIDGSKFKAVNHRDRNFTSRKMATRMALIEQSIAEYLGQLDRMDRRETPRQPRQRVRLQQRLRCAAGGDEPAGGAQGPSGGRPGGPGVADRPGRPLDGELGQGDWHRRLQRAGGGRDQASPDRVARGDERRLRPTPAEAHGRAGPRGPRHEPAHRAGRSRLLQR